MQGRDHLLAALAERDDVLVEAWEAEPGPTGSLEWDALLAALVAHEFETADRPAPPWTAGSILSEPWMPDHPFLSADRVRTQTPTWLSSRNIWIPERDLVTA